MKFTWRSKVAAVAILFFLGLAAGQFADILETVRGNVQRGVEISDRMGTTVATLRQVDTAALEAKIAELQSKLSAGTATPEQVRQLQGLVARLRGVPGPSGSPGPSGPPGASGPPGPAVAAETTTTTAGPAGTSTTTRPRSTTTTRPPTTTTTRCVVGVGRLLKVGC